MACLYKRGKTFWISYYIDNKQIKKSLNTNIERVAQSKLKKIEYDLALGDLHVASKLPLPSILEVFCRELMATRTYKSCKNDFSRLRIFFGPICESLKPGIPGVMLGNQTHKSGFDKYAGKHVKAELLEDITTSRINRFITTRIEHDKWSAKTANLMRQTLSGYIKDAQGFGLEGADIFAQLGNWSDSMVTVSDGSYSFTDVPVPLPVIPDISLT
ncbi:MAG: hypothetical protein GY869_30975 [Planctomycetes bacterium]|nr:hypothetical protein [Planctomycetota bacterium]